MELASTGAPWTTAVPWARAWHYRPRRFRPAAKTAGHVVSARDSAATDADWQAALRQLAMARNDWVAMEPDADAWVVAMRLHAVHLALARIRSLAAGLDLMQGRFTDPR